MKLLRIAIGFIVAATSAFAGAPAEAETITGNPIVGVAYDPSGIGGFWTVTGSGLVTPHVQAPFYGDLNGVKLAAPVDGIVATSDGRGYWLFARDGGVFAFGDARFYGSMGGRHLDAPVVAMSATSDGHGYWLLGTDGGVFAFGDASFYGSLFPSPVAAVAISNTGALTGYSVALSDGQLVTLLYHRGYGTAAIQKKVVTYAVDPASKEGWWMLTASGTVIPFLGASSFGDLSQFPDHQPVVAFSCTPNGQGYVIATTNDVYAFGNAV